MFRIKNIRNATVTKQTNISPAINKHQPPILANKLDKKAVVTPLVQQKDKNKIAIPKKIPGKVDKLNSNQLNKMGKADSKAPSRNINLVNKVQTINTKMNLQVHEQKLYPLKIQKQNQANDIKQKVQTRANHQILKAEVQIKKQGVQQVRSQDMVQSGIKKVQEISKNEYQKLQEFIKKEEQARKKEHDLLKQKQQEEISKKRLQQRQKRRIQRQKQEQKQLQRELQLKKMMQKIQARKKARQEQYQKRRLKQEQDKKRELNQIPTGGIVTLSDPLAHIHMSQAIMDRQINKILSMKFANFPNKDAIQHQIEELQRINCSYLLVREDPNNPLIGGLSNFRIQLFNRVGELIMQGQSKMGPQASGLHVIQTDYHNNNTNLPGGVKITRGLQNQINNVLKTRKLQTEQECAICLGTVEVSQEVYNVKCGHIFHRKCLQEWLVNTANCPACRYNIKYDHY